MHLHRGQNIAQLPKHGEEYFDSRRLAEIPPLVNESVAIPLIPSMFTNTEASAAITTIPQANFSVDITATDIAVLIAS
ncbi:hypothetical protein DdX_11968 [Ditylenchus destructor]|uniref:Uncharacterized protein n=1 Tax=Ditylenchus destructor TaxID=166010 RepID=A0AAD4MXA9_9BILA|nr:hypothetical protein DdX_11968 [Ditylenchus destructor]